jgi:glutamyl-tRNA(Gln) amidotransferase subunit E
MLLYLRINYLGIPNEREMAQFDPKKNYEQTREEIGYVSRNKASLNDYKRIGFKSGLEVHQQLKTESKLFCRCSAGVFHQNDDYDAEVIRHMRPTLSEMGVYDGTALMEFKTRKEIVYRINNQTACTYEVDDTPPFHIDGRALEIALEIALASKLHIVGEVHITRKQYLDGSIPTGFQRTAILGVEGELQLKNKKVRLIQLSIEEDSCREISDIGHRRVYKTDRLGMPLIETVTYPDCETPDELAEAAQYIRFLNRSTEKVRTGIGAGREDVNVSCAGGSRVEVKGVAHNKWIPDLSHNEAFRQYALLNIRKKLLKAISDTEKWAPQNREITKNDKKLMSGPVSEALGRGLKVWAINLPECRGILSHFTQPEKIFASEISDRLKVIACIEKPNMIHSEEFGGYDNTPLFTELVSIMKANPGDAQIILWGPKEDIPTALETVEERFRMAFVGVPEETRKSYPNGTTMFERVLPGRDRMYPDTDSPPIPLSNEYIEKLGSSVPKDISERIHQMHNWNIPQDTWTYLLSKNLVVLIERIHTDFGFDPKILGTIIGHRFRSLEGKKQLHHSFSYETLYEMFRFIKSESMLPAIARVMLPAVVAVENPDFEKIMEGMSHRKYSMKEITMQAPDLFDEFKKVCFKYNDRAASDWIMGRLHMQALGNESLSEVRKEINGLLGLTL